MSQIVSCPKCGHVLEVDDRFEKYEKITARIVNGRLAPPRTAGYDVVGFDGTTYQVKHCEAINNSCKKYKIWKWDSRIRKAIPLFFVLFGIIENNTFMFLMPYDKFEKMSSPKRFHSGEPVLRVSASISIKSWIWDYRVTVDTFMMRVSELKSIQQLTMQFTKGLNDV